MTHCWSLIGKPCINGNCKAIEWVCKGQKKLYPVVGRRSSRQGNSLCRSFLVLFPWNFLKSILSKTLMKSLQPSHVQVSQAALLNFTSSSFHHSSINISKVFFRTYKWVAQKWPLPQRLESLCLKSSLARSWEVPSSLGRWVWLGLLRL